VLYIARHGRTVANAEGRLQGRIDLPLDDLGRRQADCLARTLAGADLVLSSPLLRAVQTAEALGLPITVDDRWIELDFGEHDGLRREDIEPAMWHRLRSDIYYAPAGGESLADVLARVVPALADALELARDREVVIFTHVLPIKAALATVLGAGIDVSWRCHLDPASITQIAATSSGPVLRSFNETSHLSELA
jgi:alpha-ribazole phosphatase